MRNISPSLLSANFAILQNQINELEKMGISRIHLDVMDGHFVPNLSFGPFIIKQIREMTNMHLETHLMITSPDKYIDEYIDSGSDTLIFHYEASSDIERDLLKIKSRNIKAGIAINPDTEIKAVDKFIDIMDYLLIMSVYPGFGGQSFIESCLMKIKEAAVKKNSNLTIGVDGGVNLNTIDSVYNNGADVTIVGSGLFGAKDIHARYKDLMDDK